MIRGMLHVFPRAFPTFRWPAATVLAALAGFNLCLIVAIRSYSLPLDDAYITLHNARVLWTGADPNYGVSALIGATSPVHLWAVTLLYPLLAQGAAVAVSLLGAALYLAGVERLAQRLELPLAPTLVLVLTAVGSGSAVYQLINGLETSLALAAVTWAIVLALGAPSRALPLLCGALPFVRPELGILSAALLARQLHVRWRDKALVEGAADLLLAGAGALPWLVWVWAQTGSPLPNTAGAKVAFFADVRLPVLVKVISVLAALCFGLGFVVVAPLFVRLSSMALAMWIYALGFIALFAANFPDGLYHNSNRYAFALLPVGLWALAELWRTRRTLFRPLAALLVLVAPLFIVKGASEVLQAQAVRADAFAAAGWVSRNVPPGQPVLIHDAGVISYASDAKLVDLVGLKTPSAIAEHQRLTLPSIGARRADAIDQIARRSGVRYAIILQDKFWVDIGKGLASRHWRLDLVRAPGAPRGYAVYRLTPPPG